MSTKISSTIISTYPKILDLSNLIVWHNLVPKQIKAIYNFDQNLNFFHIFANFQMKIDYTRPSMQYFLTDDKFLYFI